MEWIRPIPGFDVLARLSSGGMGEVLLARRLGVHGFEKLVAIKTIRGDLTQRNDIRAMFLDEARLVARLDHPAIAQVYDFGESNGVLFLAMEYIAGIALNKFLGLRGGPVPPLIAAAMIAEVCRGLHAAHELTDSEGRPLGVVHRDISPGNLILTFDGHVKILDFGIAFMSGRESPDTQLGELKGKPSYMAPEQLKYEAVDRRADIYSVSVVLHELLTGKKLFSRHNVVATALAVERGEVKPPSTSIEAIPSGLDAIVMTGLEHDPTRRFPTARHMARALDEVIMREGGVSLDVFAHQELREAKRKHRAWLQGILAEHTSLADLAQSNLDPALARTPSQVPAHPLPHSAKSVPIPSLAPTTTHPMVAEHGDLTTGLPIEIIEVVKPARRRGMILAGAISIACISIVALSFAASQRPKERNNVAEESVVHPISPKLEQIPVSTVPTRQAEESAQAEAGEDLSPTVDEQNPVVVLTTKESKKRKPRVPTAVTTDIPKTQKPPVEPEEEESLPLDVTPAMPPRFGYVTIGAQPYAMIRIDGEESGVTPILRRKIRTGEHEIELIDPEHGTVRSKHRILVVEGDHLRLTE